MKKLPVLALSMGEPAGLGPEVCLRAASDAALRRRARFVLCGPRRLWQAEARRLRMPLAAEILDAGRFAPVKHGRPTAASGRVAKASLDAALALVMRGTAGALVTAPVDKGNFPAKGFLGHTDYLREKAGAPKVMMAFWEGRVLVALHSVHLPLRDALRRVNAASLLESLRFLDAQVPRYFVKKPHIAVCGLNPHAGEGGLIGDEEKRAVLPAVARARAEGLHVEGPWAPDSALPRARAEGADVLLALYHDQGLIGVKASRRFRAVNLTLGLPFIRTSPDHGVAYDVAGTKNVDASGMKAACLLAAGMAGKKAAFKPACAPASAFL
jgi:4-hydroxythreonine-4-phosphate dehydrogenase